MAAPWLLALGLLGRILEPRGGRRVWVAQEERGDAVGWELGLLCPAVSNRRTKKAFGVKFCSLAQRPISPNPQPDPSGVWGELGGRGGGVVSHSSPQSSSIPPKGSRAPDPTLWGRGWGELWGEVCLHYAWGHAW